MKDLKYDPSSVRGISLQLASVSRGPSYNAGVPRVPRQAECS